MAIDCVHDAFEKVLEYTQKKPGRRISGFILMREVNRAAKRYNKRDRPSEYNESIESDANKSKSSSTDQCEWD